MARTKYTRGADGFFRTRTWDGTYNPDGTKHRVNLKSDKSSKDLENQVNNLKNQIRERQTVRRSEVLTGDYANIWLKTYKSSREKGTHAMYKNIIDRHFVAFSIIQLQNLTRHHIQWLINERWAQPRTCQQIALTWKQMIKSAIKEKLLPAGSYIELCDDLELPKYVAEEKRPLTPEEIAAIKIADFSPKEKAFVFLIYGTGLRREEALAQNRFTINLKKKILCVNNAAGGSDELQVINGLTAHIFRHNYCTQLCYQVPTLSTKKIAKLLGDSEQMVINVYNHILEEKENAEEAIEAAVGM